MSTEWVRTFGEKGISTLRETMKTARNVVSHGGHILFVGISDKTRKTAVEAARECHQYYIDRWTPGALTRWDEHFERLHYLDSHLSPDVLNRISSPNVRRLKQERRRLEKSYQGVIPAGIRPDLIIVFDGFAERIAIEEAMQAGIPVAAIVENDADAQDITFPLRAEANAKSFIGRMIVLAACEGIASKIGYEPEHDLGSFASLFDLWTAPSLLSRKSRPDNSDRPTGRAYSLSPLFDSATSFLQADPLSERPVSFVPQEASAFFEPSDALVKIFYEGLVGHSERTGRPIHGVDPALWKRAKETLGPRILESIASRARRIAAKVVPAGPLIANGEFNYDFVLEISDNIPFRRDAYNPTFFEQLNLEITSFLAHGGSISGRWGKLLLSGGAVEFDLAAPIARPVDVWEKPKRAEWN